MAKKMALVPPELVSEYYQLRKAEIKLEDDISKLLNEKETPSDKGRTTIRFDSKISNSNERHPIHNLV
ncbi:hypothetical protein TNCV_3654821 [Trichonephila clavipes]|nr:hypothetical protein TNCV_3654821 [Trichonephila clavipes]